MAELAYAGEGTIRKAYSRDQETLPTQTHRDLCGRRREEEYSFLEGAQEREVEPATHNFCKNKVKTVCKLGSSNVSLIVHVYFLFVMVQCNW